MSYKIIEHTADLAVELSGESLGRLLESAVLAYVELLIDPDSVYPTLTKSFSVVADNPEGMLVGVVNELIYLFEVNEFVPHHASISIDGDTVYCKVFGETADSSRHEFLHCIKSATYGGLKVEFDDKRYLATLILDD